MPTDYFNKGFTSVIKVAYGNDPIVSSSTLQGGTSPGGKPTQMHQSVANRVNAPMPSQASGVLNNIKDVGHYTPVGYAARAGQAGIAAGTDNYMHGGVIQKADHAIGNPLLHTFGGQKLDEFKANNPMIGDGINYAQKHLGLDNNKILDQLSFGKDGINKGETAANLGSTVLGAAGNQIGDYAKNLWHGISNGNGSGIMDTLKNSPWLTGGLGAGVLAGGWGLSKLLGGSEQQPQQQPININVGGQSNPNGNPYTQNTQPQAFTKYSSEKLAGLPETMMSFMIGQNTAKPAAPLAPSTPIDAPVKEYHPNVTTTDPEAWKMLQHQKVQKYLADLVQQSENGVI